MSKYEFKEGMREISGFGEKYYEDTCRKMVIAGMEWFDRNPDAKPDFTTYENIYGVINEENQQAKELTKAMLEAANNDCTGAMMQACVSNVLLAHKEGWDTYVALMTNTLDDGKGNASIYGIDQKPTS